MIRYYITISNPLKSSADDGIHFVSWSAADAYLVEHGFEYSQEAELYHNGSTEAFIHFADFSFGLPKVLLYRLAKKRSDMIIRDIRETLLYNGISQDTLARISRVDKGNLSKMLSGVIYPNLRSLSRIQVALQDYCENYQVYVEHNDELPF